MNYLDIILGILLLYGLVKGVMKGLFVELSSLIALIAGIYGATHFSDYAGNFLEKSVTWEPQYTKLAAFAITFVVIILAVSALGKILTKIADFAALGIVNKLLGAAFGFLKMGFIASAIIMFLGPLNNKLELIKKETIESSLLYEKVAAFAPLILPKIMKEFKKDDEKQEDQSV
ncbi:CvpA family protein [Aquimarina agarilytica]|uniref:CvpA family protein n=1 Tax=Aquimarina agarilytica TaxID=1087449 RepID=UPI00028A3994|nr:CvpA family protein [Aquimarina agarilytica]